MKLHAMKYTMIKYMMLIQSSITVGIVFTAMLSLRVTLRSASTANLVDIATNKHEHVNDDSLPSCLLNGELDDKSSDAKLHYSEMRQRKVSKSHLLRTAVCIAQSIRGAPNTLCDRIHPPFPAPIESSQCAGLQMNLVAVCRNRWNCNQS